MGSHGDQEIVKNRWMHGTHELLYNLTRQLVTMIQMLNFSPDDYGISLSTCHAYFLHAVCLFAACFCTFYCKLLVTLKILRQTRHSDFSNTW